MIQDNEKISIIVPIYNVERYLDKCIQSILNQTYTNLEIILIDDESPDNCGIICEKYAEKDARIKVIHKKNGGLSDARNVGIEVATGEYLAFVDSDDYIESTMYEYMYRALKDTQSDLAICNFRYIGEGEYDNTNLPIKDECISGIDILTDRILGLKGHYWVVAWNKLYKKKLFDTVRYPVGKIHEDEFVIHKLFIQCEKVACVKEMLYCYLQRQNSIMSDEHAVRHMDGVEAIFQRVDYYFEINVPKVVIHDTLNKGVCVMYTQFSDKVMKNKEFVLRYKEMCRHYRKYALRVFWAGSWKDRVRMTVNMISPYLWWKMRKAK